jgi:uncharacterized membrane protein HdeD (DUF308 family)
MLILGMLMLSQWPTSAIWLIGLHIGISLLISGISLRVLALLMRCAATQSE